ncbi:MAG TPA: LysR family transcriptional regulator, partial [Microthrixaceae bacterium]|nr:LysR family transcriptional regulator [Microthrixaceae bacterium]
SQRLATGHVDYGSRVPLPPEAPSLTSLDIFVSVIELGSISAAARAHGISQPSVSARIRQLERQMGAELLTKTPNGSAPTAAGLLVVDRAESVLDATRQLLGAVDSMRRGSQRLRIAASYTVAEQLLPQWLGQLHLREPSVRVELEVVNSSGVLDQVRGGTARLGFIESAGPTTGLRSVNIGTDELLVVVGASHPWIRKRRPLRAAELAATPLVVRESGSGTREVLENALRVVGLDLVQPALELGSAAAVRAAAESGTAPAVLSVLAVAESLKSGRLRQVPVEGLDLKRPLRAVWLKSAPVEPAVDTLLALAKSD